MTGFRVAFGGAQQRFGIRPDLTTLGKVIGGGLPVGAYGGRRDIMSRVAPGADLPGGYALRKSAGGGRGPGHAALSESAPGSVRPAGGIARAALAAAPPAGVTVNRVGSMFTFFFHDGPVTDWESARRSDTARFGRFFRHMLDRGIYLAPSQYEAAFVSAVHTDEDVQKTLAAARSFAG